MDKLHVLYLYFGKYKTLPEQVQSTKEQIQQRRQKPESKVSLRNCCSTFRCSKRDKFRSERTSRRMRRRSPGLLSLDIRVLPEGLSRRGPWRKAPGPGRPEGGALTHPRRTWIPNLPSYLDNATDIRYLLDLGRFGTSIFGLLSRTLLSFFFFSFLFFYFMWRDALIREFFFQIFYIENLIVFLAKIEN